LVHQAILLIENREDTPIQPFGSLHPNRASRIPPCPQPSKLFAASVALRHVNLNFRTARVAQYAVEQVLELDDGMVVFGHEDFLP
jgi:hypothetical protein